MIYNEERPYRLSQMKGQDMNRRVFAQQIVKDSYANAYIFSGHHGCGKTTAARILARSAVCEHPTADGPCMECEACKLFDSSPDVLEIDAASNTGVDSVREEVIEAVKYRPAQMKRKIIIIDEVHMLSKSAFNALLKTVEEPPEYVIMILCTTELHKVPKTIVSRCQKFLFNAIGIEQIKENVKQISNKRGIQISDGAVSIIAKAADGSMRDALSILEQVSSSGIVDDKSVMDTLGVGSVELIDEILNCLKEKRYRDSFKYVDEFCSNSSVDVLIDMLMERIIEKAVCMEEGYLGLLSKLQEIRGRANVVVVKTVFYTFSNDFKLYLKVEKLEGEVAELKRIVFDKNNDNQDDGTRNERKDEEEKIEEVKEPEVVGNSTLQDDGFEQLDSSPFPFEEVPEEMWQQDEVPEVEVEHLDYAFHNEYEEAGSEQPPVAEKLPWEW